MRKILVLCAVFAATFLLVLPFASGSGTLASRSTAVGLIAEPVPVSATLGDSLRAPGESADPDRPVTSGSQAAPPAQAPDTAASSAQAASAIAATQASQAQQAAAAAAAQQAAQAQQQAAQAAAQPAAASCAANPGGAPGGAPGRVSGQGVGGTTSDDLASFAAAFNAIRVANCLEPFPAANIRWDSCMEDRLFWIAEDPSTDPASAWGHNGTPRSDGAAPVGCDGNLAGGSGNTGSTVAQKWWDSAAHRASLYRPGTSAAGACVWFAMSHGGVPNEAPSFTRAAARWGGC